MVFFTRILTRTIHIHPQHLGPQLERIVKDQLKRDVEGLTVDTSGFVVSVLAISLADLQKGRIDHLTGFVRYCISFNALVFRPFKNEVMVATVKAVSDVRNRQLEYALLQGLSFPDSLPTDRALRRGWPIADICFKSCK